MNILTNIRTQLAQNADKTVKTSGERFFKEKVNMYGVKTTLVGKIGNEGFQKIKQLGKNEIFSLCEDLWKSGFMEESFIACNWSCKLNTLYEESDFKLFERWIQNYIHNWASCDTFCNHTVGEFIMKFPKYISKLKSFTSSENRWVRRASAVSLIVPARKGMFLEDIFDIADRLLTDSDDMVQKGYGWMLKVASQSHQKDVFEYVMRNKARMPRTALRYAIEKMPISLKKLAMAKE